MFGPPKREVDVKRPFPGHDEGATLPGSPGITETRVLVSEVWVEEVVRYHRGKAPNAPFLNSIGAPSSPVVLWVTEHNQNQGQG